MTPIVEKDSDDAMAQRAIEHKTRHDRNQVQRPEKRT